MHLLSLASHSEFPSSDFKHEEQYMIALRLRTPLPDSCMFASAEKMWSAAVKLERVIHVCDENVGGLLSVKARRVRDLIDELPKSHCECDIRG